MFRELPRAVGSASMVLRGDSGDSSAGLAVLLGSSGRGRGQF